MQPRIDFFAAQERARRRTIMLIVPAVLALVVIIVLAYFLMVGCWWLMQDHKDYRQTVDAVEYLTGARAPAFVLWHPRLFFATAVLTTLIIAGGSLYRIIELGGQGGNYIANRLGADVVRYDTTDLEERRLVNIVEELSIASGVRIPELFIMEEDGINSFCVGHDVDSAVLIITRGAVDVLNRDELQAVLAHEFSHILNADMIINTRMVGVLHGLMMFTMMGRSLMLVRGWPFIAGAGFVALGYVGNLLGTAIQTMICRQREWLADAHAVQFTRNPGAIVSALKKIGGYPYESHVPRPFAIESAHMFFANAIENRWLFRTHPPLTNRIRALEPGFGGVYPRVASGRKATAQTIRRVETHYREGSKERGDYLRRYAGALTVAPFGRAAATHDKYDDSRTTAGGPTAPLADTGAGANIGADAGVIIGANASAGVCWPGPATTETVITRISAGPGNPLFAAAIIEEIDIVLREAAHDSGSAQLVLFGLLCDDANPAAHARQQDILASALSPEEIVRLGEMRALMAHMPLPLRLPLADLALPALKPLSAPQIDALIRTVTELIAADGKVSLYEYALRHIVIRQLRPPEELARAGMKVANMTGSVSALLSAMAYAGADTPRDALAAFEQGKKHFPLDAHDRDRLQLSAESALKSGVLAMALSHVGRAAPLSKKDILAMLARAAAHDGIVKPEEQDLLRTVAAALNCPAPVGKD
jgi:Zn-dependent protease with chaperone function